MEHGGNLRLINEYEAVGKLGGLGDSLVVGWGFYNCILIFPQEGALTYFRNIFLRCQSVLMENTRCGWKKNIWKRNPIYIVFSLIKAWPKRMILQIFKKCYPCILRGEHQKRGEILYFLYEIAAHSNI